MKIEKAWDGNELVNDRGNRVYISRGRWQWIVVLDNGEIDSAHDLKREALARAELIRKAEAR